MLTVEAGEIVKGTALLPLQEEKLGRHGRQHGLSSTACERTVRVGTIRL